MTREDLEAEMAEIDSKIAAIHAQLDPLYARKNRVRDILNGPRVLVVAHYWLHGSRKEAVFDTIEEAFSYLDYDLDYDWEWADGVTVGGAPVERGDYEY